MDRTQQIAGSSTASSISERRQRRSTGYDLASWPSSSGKTLWPRSRPKGHDDLTSGPGGRFALARAAAQRLAYRRRVADQPCGRGRVELVSALRLGLMDVGVEDVAARLAVAGVHGSLRGIELGEQAALNAVRQSEPLDIGGQRADRRRGLRPRARAQQPVDYHPGGISERADEEIVDRAGTADGGTPDRFIDLVCPVNGGAVHRQAGGGAGGGAGRGADAGTDDEGRVGAAAVEVGPPDFVRPVRPVQKVAVERYALGAEEVREQGEVGAGAVEVGPPDQARASPGIEAPVDKAVGGIDRHPGGRAERVDEGIVDAAAAEGGPPDRASVLVHPVDEAVRAVDRQRGGGADEADEVPVGVGAVEVGAPDEVRTVRPVDEVGVDRNP